MTLIWIGIFTIIAAVCLYQLRKRTHGVYLLDRDGKQHLCFAGVNAFGYRMTTCSTGAGSVRLELLTGGQVKVWRQYHNAPDIITWKWAYPKKK